MTGTTMHFGREHSGRRTACGRLVEDLLIYRGADWPRVTCQTCTQTAPYRLARELAGSTR